jgi:hypothetical protein
MLADGIFVLSVAVMLGVSFYCRRRIQDNKIAVQWGLDGKTTWRAPRAVALWGPPVFAILVRGVIYAATNLTPDKVHHVDIGLVLFSIVVAGVHIVTLTRAR